MRYLLICLISISIVQNGSYAMESTPIHGVVAAESGQFLGWPANCGIWSWDNGREVLVGFVSGPWTSRQGHNIGKPYRNRLARTRDGGKTWVVESPQGYYQPGDTWKPMPPSGIDWSHPDTIIRVICDGYHAGGGPASGMVQLSNDRGRSWLGPLVLPEITDPQTGKSLALQLSARTELHRQPDGTIRLLGSAKENRLLARERCFSATWTDSGRRLTDFRWITPATVSERTIMPASTWDTSGKGLAVVRVRPEVGGSSRLDAYAISPQTQQWKSVGTIADTGPNGGNPAALLTTRAGRIVCVYGNRSDGSLRLRWRQSWDADWQPEMILRKDFARDAQGEMDLGYPRMVENAAGELVIVYYWADRDHPQGMIAVTRWKP
ncbi:hypothetical protein [Tuwongella immobilis]|uniref:Sialidase domain-containing protein n=1 Tax=Tuwongella immobilis TaxID=692036 RepID=A0A6C2YIP3_9BACT|nr:hypothetical protein [Tuwongella immobilis]VIP01400.1 Uncharacterized protein OS=Cyclobacteriaceae bacterium AK24 GN=ADIS_2455 PE=4 SV=1 [Tuwongella immobilis]VTR98293.1 Uncharacterized protein OS=Cyclobacteriaceae bacterium AK24 GN=ADIS_2455 PE=4 SV=1 [Tuwongella immobilis]